MSEIRVTCSFEDVPTGCWEGISTQGNRETVGKEENTRDDGDTSVTPGALVGSAVPGMSTGTLSWDPG